ncbi:MAG: zinc-ribbon domain-containing protein [Clostridia bacterium]|nr:zinc-ribbon domain-containing protein [Clostridia bacterium]
MKCTNCGFDIQVSDAAFCPKCGTKVEVFEFDGDRTVVIDPRKMTFVNVAQPKETTSEKDSVRVFDDAVKNEIPVSNASETKTEPAALSVKEEPAKPVFEAPVYTPPAAPAVTEEPEKPVFVPPVYTPPVAHTQPAKPVYEPPVYTPPAPPVREKENIQPKNMFLDPSDPVVFEKKEPEAVANSKFILQDDPDVTVRAHMNPNRLAYKKRTEEKAAEEARKKAEENNNQIPGNFYQQPVNSYQQSSPVGRSPVKQGYQNMPSYQQNAPVNQGYQGGMQQSNNVMGRPPMNGGYQNPPQMNNIPYGGNSYREPAFVNESAPSSVNNFTEGVKQKKSGKSKLTVVIVIIVAIVLFAGSLAAGLFGFSMISKNKNSKAAVEMQEIAIVEYADDSFNKIQI